MKVALVGGALLAGLVGAVGCDGGRIQLGGAAPLGSDGGGAPGVDGGASMADGDGDPGAPRVAPPVTFTDVTRAAGLPTASTMCLVFSDLDGDGRPDLLLAGVDGNGRFAGALDLWKNRGDGSFARSAIPLPLFAVSSCRAVDWSGDGRLDLVVAGGTARDRRLAFLRGDGAGGFTNVTRAVFTDDLAQPGVVNAGPIGVVDADGDGWPDVLLGNFVWPDPGLSKGCVGPCSWTTHDFECHFDEPMPVRQVPLVYRNLGGQRFERSPMPGLRAEESSVFGFLDWDGDGFVDLFAANDFGHNALYHNDRGAALRDVLPTWRDNPYNHGMGVAFADFNRDGRWDFYVADLGPDRLYLGQPDGTADNHAAALHIESLTRRHSGWSPLAEDFNADGWVDLLVANAALTNSDDELAALASSCAPVGGGGTARPQADFLLLNERGAGFSSTELLHTDTRPAPLRGGVAAADYDGDGDLDVVVLLETVRASVRLLRNDTPGAGARSLTVKLLGRAPATGALGAQVVARVGGREIARRVAGSGGSLGDSSGVLHFGLGDLPAVDELEVRWPSGRSQLMAGPFKAGSAVTITQP